MRLKTTFLIPLLCCAFLSSAQFSVPTINVERVFYDWRDSGVNCDENVSSYWYILKNELNAELKQKVRYCGGSVLYIGVRNSLHLYHQGITVSCDSVTSLLKLDSNFLNILPPVVDEKVSYNIYRDSGLYYIDSINLIFKAQVEFSTPPDDQIYVFLKTCVDSVEGEGNNTWVYGTREEMYCIAQNINVKNVYDIDQEAPVNCKSFKISPHKIISKASLTEKSSYDLNGRIISDKMNSTFYRVYHGKLELKSNRRNK